MLAQCSQPVLGQLELLEIGSKKKDNLIASFRPLSLDCFSNINRIDVIVFRSFSFLLVGPWLPPFGFPGTFWCIYLLYRVLARPA